MLVSSDSRMPLRKVSDSEDVDGESSQVPVYTAIRDAAAIFVRAGGAYLPPLPMWMLAPPQEMKRPCCRVRARCRFSCFAKPPWRSLPQGPGGQPPHVFLSFDLVQPCS